MCGRYYFHLDGKHAEVLELRKKIQQMQLSDFVEKEVFPTQKALVLVQGKETYEPKVKPWGIHGYQDRLIINARMEGIEQKRTFAPYIKNRCVIPCNSFYEWIRQGVKKEKIQISKKDRPLLYLAGFFNQKDEFVIVTGASINEMQKVHDRTPIILTRNQIDRYLRGEMPFIVNNEDLIFQKQ